MCDFLTVFSINRDIISVLMVMGFSIEVHVTANAGELKMYKAGSQGSRHGRHEGDDHTP